jgi:hypothetical protein
MTDPILWNLEPHTAAKHRVLRSYLDGWIAAMGQQALRVATAERPRLLFVDGFAGPGRYATGEPGSPLIMLEALLEHSAFGRLGDSGRLLDFPRCEVLSFLPLSFVHRFVGRAGQENAMNSLFGCEDWKAAIAMKGAERTQFLLELFERQLGRNGGVQHVRSFQLQTEDGEDYRLCSGSGISRALRSPRTRCGRSTQ